MFAHQRTLGMLCIIMLQLLYIYKVMQFNFVITTYKTRCPDTGQGSSYQSRYTNHSNRL